MICTRRSSHCTERPPALQGRGRCRGIAIPEIGSRWRRRARPAPTKKAPARLPLPARRALVDLPTGQGAFDGDPCVPFLINDASFQMYLSRRPDLMVFDGRTFIDKSGTPVKRHKKSGATCFICELCSTTSPMGRSPGSSRSAIRRLERARARREESNQAGLRAWAPSRRGESALLCKPPFSVISKPSSLVLDPYLLNSSVSQSVSVTSLENARWAAR